MLPVGIALFLRFFGAPSRPVFSAVGLFILTYWLMPDKQFESIFGTFESGTDKFFAGGILTVIGATQPNVAVIDAFALDAGDLGGDTDALIITDLTPDYRRVHGPGAVRRHRGHRRHRLPPRH